MDTAFKKYKMKYCDSYISNGNRHWRYCYGDKRRTIVASIDKMEDGISDALFISYSFPKTDGITEAFRESLLEFMGMDTSKPIKRFEGTQRLNSIYGRTQFNAQLLTDCKEIIFN